MRLEREGVTIYRGEYLHKSAKIGQGTRIGAGHDIGWGVEIGEGCEIKCHVSISNGWKIGDRVFIGPGVRFMNTKYPRSKRNLPGFVGDDAVICGSATIGPGVKLGERSVIAMGATVRKDVAPNTVIVGDDNQVIYDRDEYERRRKEHESSQR